MGDAAVALAAPAAEAPEVKSEKRRATTIHAESIAEFIAQAGIVLGIDGDVVAGHQVGQRHRHQRPLDQSPGKTGRMRVALEQTGNAMEQDADDKGEDSDDQDAFDNGPNPGSGGWVHDGIETGGDGRWATDRRQRRHQFNQRQVSCNGWILLRSCL